MRFEPCQIRHELISAVLFIRLQANVIAEGGFQKIWELMMLWDIRRRAHVSLTIGQ
jgi:hypothetical protein